MLLVDLLTKKENFSKSEEIISDYIIYLGENIKEYSARRIAKETYNSPATVLNLCKKVGKSGFQNFKDTYLEELEYLNRQYGMINPNVPFKDGDSIDRVANKLGILYKETIDDTLSLLHHDLFQKAIQILMQSENIHIYSKGTALNIAESFKEKLMKIGKNVYIVSNTNYQRYDVYCIKKQDCAIFISYSGETISIIQMAEVCVQRCIPIIAMTSYGENTLSRMANVCLHISTRENLKHNIANFNSNLSISFILDILYSAYFSMNHKKNFEYKIAVTQKLEGNRHSTNPILSDLGEKNEQC